jgi:hypothetical protein
MVQLNQELVEGQLSVVYDLYRDALLNRKYYGGRLASYQRWNTWVELIVAFGTSAGVGGWYLWETNDGKIGWAIVAGLAVVLGIVKTVIRYSQHIERYSKLYTNHSIFYSELDQVVSQIRAQQGITPDMFRSVVDTQRKVNLLSSEDDPHPSRRLLRKYYKVINEEVPPENFWMPRHLETQSPHASSS